MFISVLRHGYRIFQGLLILTVIGSLASCQQDIPNDRVLIQQRLQAMAKAVESRQLGNFNAAIHPNFLGQRNLRKGNLSGLLLLHFRQHPSISVSVSRLEIQPEGDRATVSFRAHVSGQGGWLSEGRWLRVESRWVKSEEAWLVERARWQVVPGESG